MNRTSLSFLVSWLLVVAASGGISTIMTTLAKAKKSNPLIGRWVPYSIPKDSNGRAANCADMLIFTTNHQQVIYKGQDNGKGVDVTYNVSPKYVYVIGNTGTAVRYNITGPDTIEYNGYPNCGYKRTQ
jgi:hypothetical protein